MKKDINTIKFNGYMIQKFLLEKSDIPSEQKGNIELNCNSFKSNTKGKENSYRVSLNIVTYTDKSRINLILDGYFEISNDLDEKGKYYFLNVSAPAIIYPYARTFISNVTAFDIDDTVILPVINFADPKLRNKEEEDLD